ncbi:MAG: LicD family protein [Clostridia bacterium]|nr:LicD family protein [Clostridia bacterium]
MRKLKLDEIKRIELEILKSVVEFCEEHDITYFLAYGTLIGAVRHKGFIPWDDDIDIQMPRSDYDKFISIFKEKNENPDLIMIAPTDKISRHTFVKVIDTRTLKVEEGVSYKNGNLGIDIDIFPIDGQPDDEQEFFAWYQEKMQLYKKNNLTIVDTNKMNFKGKFLCLLNRIFGANHRYFKKAEKLRKKYPYESSKFVGSTASLYNSKKNRYRKECYESAIDVAFEQYTFKAPVGYDEILTAMYGDYMTLPKNQQTHHVNECYMKDEKGIR